MQATKTRCEICGEESNIIYAMRKYGLICGKCKRELKENEEEKLIQREYMLEMYKRYGIDV